jgi:ArsR family transcriptional regulator
MEPAQFNRVAKALADPQRMALLERIARGGSEEVACRDLVGESGLAPATVSHHLKELTTAGLVSARKQGQCMYLTASGDVLAGYVRELNRRVAMPKGTKAY